MKLIFLAPSFHSNLFFPIKGLVDAGHKVKVLTLYRGKLEGDYDDVVKPITLGYSLLFILLNKIFNRQLRIYLKNNFELKYSFPPLIKLFVEMMRFKPEIVVIKNIESVYSLIGAVFAKIIGAKIVFTLQIDKYRQKRKSWSVSLVGLVFGAPVLTPLLGDQAGFGNENRNLHYVPFVTETINEERIYFFNGTIKILTVGKFVRRKNHLLLLRVFKELVKQYSVHLTIIGERADESYVKEVEDYIKQKNLSLKVSLRYDLLFKQVLKEYLNHDIFVLASSDEPAAASPLGAMSRGLAVISSSANGTRCYIETGKNGFVFEDKNETDLRNKLEILLCDKTKIVEFGKYSLELARTKHKPEIFVKEIIKLVNMSKV
jgi:glycosyltransferase involved in cell wall biosynthesis